jgi:hypothetical protein
MLTRIVWRVQKICKADRAIAETYKDQEDGERWRKMEEEESRRPI